MNAALVWPIAFLCLGMTACASPNQFANPSSISLDVAINEVADSLFRLQQKTADRNKIGLIVDEATVEFTIAASATNTASAGATLSALKVAGGDAGLSVSNELVNTGNRGNVIKITFKNLATADYSKGGAEMAERCLQKPQLPVCKTIMREKGAES